MSDRMTTEPKPAVILGYDPLLREKYPQAYDLIEQRVADFGARVIDLTSLTLPRRELDWPRLDYDGVVIEATSTPDTSIETARSWVDVIRKADREHTPVLVLRHTVGARAVESALFEGIADLKLYGDVKQEAVPALLQFLHERVRNQFLMKETEKNIREQMDQGPLTGGFIATSPCSCPYHMQKRKAEANV